MAYILLLEDETASAEILQATVEELTDHKILPYANGAEAADAIKGGLKYDLAILDIILPGLSGHKVLPISKEYNPGAPVIALSALPPGHPISDGHSISHGFDAYLQKPFSPVALIDMICKYIPNTVVSFQ